jgi:asparagine synthase (glutamine-hydrolysing)
MTPARFLAIVDFSGPEGAIPLKRRIAGRGKLAPVFDSAPLTILAAPGTRILRAGDRGLIVGNLFRAASFARVDTRCGDAIADRDSIPTDRYWGDYVALTARPDNRSATIVRSPSGGVHAFRIRAGPLVCVASHIEDLIDAGLATPTIDWAFTAHHLAFSHLHTGTTGLAGVDEILPGECAIERDGRCERSTLWSPWTFTTGEGRAAGFDDAAARVREAVLRATAALVPPGETVALELSGGLDSSIVAAALAAAGSRTVALNLATPGAEGDERRYARAVSEHMKIPLIETRVEGDIDLTEVAPHLEARPAMLAMLRLADRAFAERGRDHRVGAFVNGTGGDCVFCSLGTAAPAVDRLRVRGMTAGLAATIGDIAAVHGDNVWTAARMAFRLHRRGPPVPIWRRNRKFLNNDRLPDAPAPHPWLDEPPGALPGTRAHIHAILASYAHLDGYGRHKVAPSLFPLLSQPVVEACLSVPTWLWVAGGRDRAVAREAFRGALPRMIVERRTKGGMDAFCARTFERNRARLRPFLLDGQLAAAGLLDRTAIEAYLAQPFANRDQLFYALLPIADTEAWARRVAAPSP